MGCGSGWSQGGADELECGLNGRNCLDGGKMLCGCCVNCGILPCAQHFFERVEHPGVYVSVSHSLECGLTLKKKKSKKSALCLPPPTPFSLI